MNNDPFSACNIPRRSTNSFVPAAGTTEFDPEAEFEVVTGRPSEGPVDVVQINGFGFGGQNA